jgi:ABC-type multidrug transport system permease subunit
MMLDVEAATWRWMLLIGPILSVLAGAVRTAIEPDGLGQAAFATAVGLLLVGWMTNRNVPFMRLIGAVATALVLAFAVLVVINVMPPPGDDIGLWTLAWVVLPAVYGIGLLVTLVGFVGLIWLGPLAD